jgi:TlyA family rRNA methyltransferase/putative hemolysin
MKKERVDKVLVEKGLAESCQKAQALIMAGLVYAGGKPAGKDNTTSVTGPADRNEKEQGTNIAGQRIEKPGQLIDPSLEISIQKTLPYVSRGGLKLEEALEAFKIIVSGRTAADIGSSTGGFTDCLIQRGAAKVYAVDVDIRQLDRRLRENPRVIAIEKNARYLTFKDFVDLPEIIAMDVSFISILKILPAIKALIEQAKGVIAAVNRPRNDIRFNGKIATAQESGKDININSVKATDQEPRNDIPFLLGDTTPDLGLKNWEPGTVSAFDRSGRLLLSLIKPQFEARKGQVGKRGVVRNPAVHRQVLQIITEEAAGLGYHLRGLIRSSVRGQKGNREFFALWTLDGLPPRREDVLQWIQEVTRDEKD